MNRRHGTAVRPDGRLRLRVDLPADVIDLADRLAEDAGLDREAILGDLASAGLPAVLADLADGAVGRAARRRLDAFALDMKRPRGLPGASSHNVTAPSVVRSVPDDPDHGVSGGDFG